MTFDPYDPGERRVTGRTHAASWLVWGLLIVLLMIAGPEVGSGLHADRLATLDPAGDSCRVARMLRG